MDWNLITQHVVFKLVSILAYIAIIVLGVGLITYTLVRIYQNRDLRTSDALGLLGGIVVPVAIAAGPSVYSQITTIPISTIITATPTNTAIVPNLPISLPDAEVVNNDVNMRTGPGIDFARVGSYSKGTTLKAIGIDAEKQWLYAEAPDKKVGWIKISLLKIHVNIANLPVIPQTTMQVPANTVVIPQTEPSNSVEPTIASSNPSNYQTTFIIRADSDWQDTGVYVTTGNQVKLQQISGTWSPCAPPYSCPYVDANGWPDWKEDSYTNACTHATLLIKLSNSSEAICSGKSYDFQVTTNGTLQFRINDVKLIDNDGEITVQITITK